MLFLSVQDNLQVEDREVNHHGNAVKVVAMEKMTLVTLVSMT